MRNQRILVVDDDPKVVKFIQKNLEAKGYELLTAGAASEALNTIRTKLPDLVILDLMLPSIDGFEICRLVREFSQVPIIILSARGDTGDKVRSLSLGADDYITKPFDIAVLMARIGIVLKDN